MAQGLPFPDESEYWGENPVQESGEIQPMTLPRIRCSCGKVIPRMLDRYLEEFVLDQDRERAMNRALIVDPCCRTQVVSPIILPLGSGVSIVTRAGNNVEWRHSSMQQPRSIRQQIDLHINRITGMESIAQQPTVSLQQAMEELYQHQPALTNDVIEEIYSYTAR